MTEYAGVTPISAAKLEANRRNATRSSGPKSSEGKKRSRLNALKHGILTSELLILEGPNAEDARAFNELLAALRQDFAPEGALEDLLVEKIAVCFWRQRRVLKCEAGLAIHDLALAFRQNRGYTGNPTDPILGLLNEKENYFSGHMTIPLSENLDRLLRYETSVQKQLAHTINQLERLQRSRKGESVHAPVTLQVSTDH